MTKQVRMYVATWNGKQWQEHLDTRVATRLVSSVPTGVTYQTFREMDEAIALKNQAFR